eukprot:Skav202734  [mRNA]  locus=scaffold1326:206808:210231:- [translate_table: standard]
MVSGWPFTVGRSSKETVSEKRCVRACYHESWEINGKEKMNLQSYAVLRSQDMATTAVTRVPQSRNSEGDGDLDLALVSLSESIRFFDHSMNAITERPSPFVATPTCDVGDGIFLSSGFSMADWDGDGALDLIAATSAGAAICKQIDGALHLITDHPFTQIGTFEAISMVDWDKDGDLDLLVKRKHELICFEQENGGNIEHVLPVGRIWHFSVFDRDSVVDLLISRYPDGGARYFKQDGHLEELFEDYNPFEKILADYNPHGQLPLFALNDWTGDREVDFLLITTEKMRLYEQKQDRNLKALASRVLCPPSESFCKQGNCHPERRQCDCPPGIEGPQCTQCSMSKGRYSAECNKCPGHGSPNGTCQRRGMCQEIQEGIGFDNSQGIEGTAICMCFAPFFGKNCEEGSCPQGQFLHTDADIFLRSTWYPHWEACMPCAPGVTTALLPAPVEQNALPATWALLLKLAAGSLV